ncbi:hypothetical protein PTTG_30289, partial [Puccinia triticina 1-1 BBBD Race 1]
MINLSAVTTPATKTNTRSPPLSLESDEEVEELGGSEPDESLIQPKPKFSAIFTPTVISVLLGSLLVFFQMSSLVTLILLFVYTRSEDGGLLICDRW